MKIKEIIDSKPVTLEGPQIDALKAVFKSGDLGSYLRDRKVIMVGKKVAQAFGHYMSDIEKQQKQTFGLSQKELMASPTESFEKLGDIMQLTKEEEQQLTEEVLQEILPALIGAGRLASGALGAVGKLGKAAVGAAGRTIKKAKSAANQALANRAEKQMQAKAAQTAGRAAQAAGRAAATPPKPGDVDGDGDADAEDSQRFQDYVRDFASNKVFMQNTDRITDAKIKQAVSDTIKTMQYGDKNEQQWIKLVALAQQSDATEPGSLGRQAKQALKLTKDGLDVVVKKMQDHGYGPNPDFAEIQQFLSDTAKST